MSSQQPAEVARARAEARFKLQEQRAADARKVTDEIAAAGQAERLKTARLRALRLERDEADRAAAAAKPPVVKKASKPRVAKA